MRSRQLGYALLLTVPFAACKGKDSASAEGTDTTMEVVASKSSDPNTVFPVKSGIIEWKSDMMGDITITLYFDDHGAKRATYTTTKVEIMRTTHTSREVEIEADGWRINYDLDEKTGTRQKLSSLDALTGFGSMAGMPDIPKNVTDIPGVEELESRTYFGKEARGYAMEMMGMKVRAWTWEGIAFRTEMDMGGEEPVVVEVTRLELGVDVPADKFVVPADIVIANQ